MQNELLLILMGFVVLMMIVMAIMLGTRPKKPPASEPIEEPKPERILIEKGFENHIKEEPIEKPEEVIQYEPPIEEPVIEEEEPEEIVEQTPVLIEEPQAEEVPSDTEPIPEPEPMPEEPEQEYTPLEETIEITPVEPMIIEPMELEEPSRTIDEPPRTSEPDMDVVITPGQTFYDPVIVEPAEEAPPKIEDSPTLDEATEPEKHEIEDIPEVELPPLEPEEPAQVPEEIEPEVKEEPEPEPMVPIIDRPRGRIRKPVIDESDPDLKIDLGTETCPHCGSKVPATIYCINCGKALSPNNVPEEEEV